MKYGKVNWNKKPYDNPTKYTMIDKNNTKYCSCGHTVEFWHGENKVLCNWCKNYVFKNKKDEFSYRMKEQMSKK